MRRISTYHSWIVIIAMAITMGFNFAYAGVHPIKSDTTSFFHKKAKKSYLKNGLTFSLPPLKPGVTSYVKFTVAKPDDKLLSDVEIANPVTDQLNLKYVVSHNTNVSIKIMDVLGNDLITVFQQRVDSGDQKFSYSLNNKLSRGFYFVRIVAGTESVIKRISIL